METLTDIEIHSNFFVVLKVANLLKLCQKEWQSLKKNCP